MFLKLVDFGFHRSFTLCMENMQLKTCKIDIACFWSPFSMLSRVTLQCTVKWSSQIYFGKLLVSAVIGAAQCLWKKQLRTCWIPMISRCLNSKKKWTPCRFCDMSRIEMVAAAKMRWNCSVHICWWIRVQGCSHLEAHLGQHSWFNYSSVLLKRICLVSRPTNSFVFDLLFQFWIFLAHAALEIVCGSENVMELFCTYLLMNSCARLQAAVISGHTWGNTGGSSTVVSCWNEFA